MLSPLAAAVAELLADGTVTARVGTRVRPVEPGPGDAKAPGSFQRFVVLSILDAPWQASTATSSVSLGIRAYGVTFADAEDLFLLCAATFHRKGPRVAATSRLGIYGSLANGGGTLDKDPDTKQPYAYGVVTMNTSIQPTPV